MSTQSITASNTPLLVADSDTYVSTSEDEPVTAVLPDVNDGSGSTVAVGTEIRFEATGGSPIRIETFDGRLVGRCPGRSQVVVVAQAGAQESETDAWALMPLANDPSANQTISGTFTQSEIQAIRDCLVDHGLMKAE